MALLYLVLFVFHIFGLSPPASLVSTPVIVPSLATVVAPSPPPTTTTTTVPVVPTPVSQEGYDHRWDAVAICEEGGWGNYGFPAYPDSLGINATNWYAYNGGSDLSPANQARVGAEIEAAGGVPGFVPDQNGCASW